jgi:hypothetical protein
MRLNLHQPHRHPHGRTVRSSLGGIQESREEDGGDLKKCLLVRAGIGFPARVNRDSRGSGIPIPEPTSISGWGTLTFAKTVLILSNLLIHKRSVTTGEMYGGV